MYGNPAVDCDGAQMRALCRQLATVVTVNGEIDDANLDCISAYAKRFVLTEKPFVLDLSDVNSFTPHMHFASLRPRRGLPRTRASSGRSSQANRSSRGLRLSGERETFPTAGSVPEALHHFADSIGERRRLLPLLTKTA